MIPTLRSRLTDVRVGVGGAAAALLLACGSTHSKGLDGSIDDAPCASGYPLAGAIYDIAKSRFAFGSTPVPVDAGPLVQWTGSDGVVAIWNDGSEQALLDANAPEFNLPGWSGDAESLDAHVIEYFESMGVDPCQIAGTGESGGEFGVIPVAGDGGTLVAPLPITVNLVRGVSGVRVVDSLAVADFDSSDQTTHESFYWPEIPADVVTEALAFQTQLAAPGALAAYQAKLPTDAQGPGRVVIHHTVAASGLPFIAVAVYDTIVITPDDSGGDVFFDENGNPVTDTWE